MTTLFVGLISLASFYFFYLHRGLIVGHDIVLEIVRLVETKQALLSQFYPRLAPDLYAGYGSPVLVFYPPLFPLLTSLVDFAFDNFNHSVKLVIITLGVIGSLFCYSFLRLFSRRDAALLGAVFYVLAPYKFTDVYARNAFAEYTALGLLPVVFYFLASNFVGQESDSIRSRAGLFFSFLLLSLSHTISLLIAFPFVLLSAFYFHWRTKPDSNGQSSKETTSLVRTLAIMFLALGSASFYLLPAFVYRNLVQTENFTTGKFYFGGNFVNFFEIFFNNSSFLYQSPIPLIALLCGLLFLLLRVTPVLAESPLGRLGVGFSLACLFMMSSLSFFLWNVLPLIRYAQFPWRFLLFFTFFMCWIVAFIADQFLPRYEFWVRGAVAAYILLLGGTHHAQYMQSKIFDATTITSKQILYSNLRATAAAEDLPSVVPKTTELRISERRKAIESRNGNKKSPDPTQYTRCQSFPEKIRFEFALFNFPFWKLSVDGVPALRSPDAPMLQTEVPAGAHCVEARLGFLVLQVVGFFTSALSLVLFCGFAAWSRRSIRAGPFR
jgi:hypothetical protein